MIESIAKSISKKRCEAMKGHQRDGLSYYYHYVKRKNVTEENLEPFILIYVII
jgi:hypothetical protein